LRITRSDHPQSILELLDTDEVANNFLLITRKQIFYVIIINKHFSSTYDHRLERTGHPVRSAIHKLQIGGLVVGSVTTSEYPLLYVFAFLPFLRSSPLIFEKLRRIQLSSRWFSLESIVASIGVQDVIPVSNKIAKILPRG
jgi:hypothetical protein